ncbi:putative E3 ubiquitin-protein ligase herc4 [Nowakowskiella sp. JEL0407]|nr:putative E3 ubiquitin-protein ligase herc4 [Nowakowskiella sp. JEL0407]
MYHLSGSIAAGFPPSHPSSSFLNRVAFFPPSPPLLKNDRLFSIVNSSVYSWSLFDIAPKLLPSSLSFTKIFPANSYTLATDSLNDLYIWGFGSETPSLLLRNVSSVASGNDQSIVSTRSDDIFTFTCKPEKSLFSFISSKTKVELPYFESPKKVYCGNNYFLVQTESGNLYTWGSNEYGQLGVGDFSFRSVPTKIDFPANVYSSSITSISVGEYFAVAVVDFKDIYIWGTILPLSVKQSLPQPISSFSPANEQVIQVSCGSKHLAVVLKTNDGTKVLTSGMNTHGQCGLIHSEEPVDLDVVLELQGRWAVDCDEYSTIVYQSENSVIDTSYEQSTCDYVMELLNEKGKRPVGNDINLEIFVLEPVLIRVLFNGAQDAINAGKEAKDNVFLQMIKSGIVNTMSSIAKLENRFCPRLPRNSRIKYTRAFWELMAQLTAGLRNELLSEIITALRTSLRIANENFSKSPIDPRQLLAVLFPIQFFFEVPMWVDTPFSEIHLEFMEYLARHKHFWNLYELTLENFRTGESILIRKLDDENRDDEYYALTNCVKMIVGVNLLLETLVYEEKMDVEIDLSVPRKKLDGDHLKCDCGIVDVKNTVVVLNNLWKLNNFMFEKPDYPRSTSPEDISLTEVKFFPTSPASVSIVPYTWFYNNSVSRFLDIPDDFTNFMEEVTTPSRSNSGRPGIRIPSFLGRAASSLRRSTVPTATGNSNTNSNRSSETQTISSNGNNNPTFPLPPLPSMMEFINRLMSDSGNSMGSNRPANPASTANSEGTTAQANSQPQESSGSRNASTNRRGNSLPIQLSQLGSLPTSLANLGNHDFGARLVSAEQGEGSISLTYSFMVPASISGSDLERYSTARLAEYFSNHMNGNNISNTNSGTSNTQQPAQNSGSDNSSGSSTGFPPGFFGIGNSGFGFSSSVEEISGPSLGSNIPASSISQIADGIVDSLTAALSGIGARGGSTTDNQNPPNVTIQPMDEDGAGDDDGDSDSEIGEENYDGVQNEETARRSAETRRLEKAKRKNITELRKKHALFFCEYTFLYDLPAKSVLFECTSQRKIIAHQMEMFMNSFLTLTVPTMETFKSSLLILTIRRPEITASISEEPDNSSITSPRLTGTVTNINYEKQKLFTNSVAVSPNFRCVKNEFLRDTAKFVGVKRVLHVVDFVYKVSGIDTSERNSDGASGSSGNNGSESSLSGRNRSNDALKSLTKPLRIQFQDELGVDQGGVSNEFMRLFWSEVLKCTDLFDEVEKIGSSTASGDKSSGQESGKPKQDIFLEKSLVSERGDSIVRKPELNRIFKFVDTTTDEQETLPVAEKANEKKTPISQLYQHITPFSQDTVSSVTLKTNYVWFNPVSKIGIVGISDPDLTSIQENIGSALGESEEKGKEKVSGDGEYEGEQSQYILDSYKLLGRMLGIALYNKCLCSLSYFPPVLFKKLCGHPVSFEDLKVLDPGVAKSMEMLIEYDEDTDGGAKIEDVFGLDFTIVKKVYDVKMVSGSNATAGVRNIGDRTVRKRRAVMDLSASYKMRKVGRVGQKETTVLSDDETEVEEEVVIERMKVFELIPGGSNIAVTKENRNMYVDAYVRWVLVDSVKDAFNAFKEGVNEVCDESILKMFSPFELERIVRGSQTFDFADLERVAKYRAPYHLGHPVVRRFWSVVHSFTPTQKREFLRFVTGTDRVPPIRGLRGIALLIQPSGGTGQTENTQNADASNAEDQEIDVVGLDEHEANTQDPSSTDNDTAMGGEEVKEEVLETDLRLPSAHTCSNVLDLPPYSSEEKLREKLVYAMLHGGGGFHLV